MSATTRVGTALAAGYVLGRFRKMRLALIVGSALANQNVRSQGLGLLQQGAGKLTSSPQGQELSKQISGQLMQAGRAAAMTVAASGVDRLSDRLHERSENLRDSGKGASGQSEEPEDEADEQSEDQADQEPEDEADEEPGDQADEADEEPEDEADEADEEPEDEYDELEDEADEADEADEDEPEDEYDELEDEADEDEPEDEPDDEADEDEPEDEPEDEADEDEPEAEDEDVPRRRRRATAPAGGGR